MKKIKVKLNQNLLGFKKNQVITLTQNNYGVKITPYWNKRLKDSVIDNCLEIVKTKKKKTVLSLKKIDLKVSEQKNKNSISDLEKSKIE